jgi:hypothetical protein
VGADYKQNKRRGRMMYSRRRFIKTAALAASAFTIVPRHVLGKGHVPPSDKINVGFIGLGRQSRGLARRFVELTDAQIVAGSDVWTTKMEWFRQHVSSVPTWITKSSWIGMTLTRS